MASWIKMRTNLWDDPRVAALVDATDSSEAAVVGGLYWLWASADEHSTDGDMHGLSLRQIDRKTGVAGFAAALVAIGWIEEVEGGIRVARFDEHNGASAKTRAQTARRVARHKEVTQESESGNAGSVTNSLPVRDLEKDREEEQEPKSASLRSGASAPSPEERDPIWHTGLDFLVRKGVPIGPARSFLGLLRKEVRDDLTVAALLVEAETQDVSHPQAWLTKAAKERKAQQGAGNAVRRPNRKLSAVEQVELEIAERERRNGFIEGEAARIVAG